MLTGAGEGNITDADSDHRIKVHTNFDLPILDGGIVKIDLDTAGDNHDIVIDDDTPVFGMILDNAGAGVVPCSLIEDEVSGPESNCGVYTITKEKPLELKFTDADKYVGKTLRVDCYSEKTSGAMEITIDAKNFAGNYYVEASTLFREQSTAMDMPAEIVIPNVKIQSNFTFSMAASGDPSTFTFTMDAFPDYTAFNKQNKVFAAIQIIGEENIKPDVADDAYDEDTCKPLEVALTGVKGGATGWAETQFEGDPRNIKFASLGNNLAITMERANLDFTGNLRRIDNWTAFSDKPADLTGYYFPFTLEAEKGVKLVRTALNGEEIIRTFGETGDTDTTMNLIWAVDPKAPVITTYLESADGSKKQEYSFDFSKVVFK